MSRSWKAHLQMSDLNSDVRIEVECKTCGFFRYEEVSEWQKSRLMRQLYLDEFEDRLRCQKWGCGKPVRIALPSSVETEGFQGGLA
ncbi:MAG: hypothetical protein ACSHXY_01465 [Alphaproteobacteria bacterium]